MKEKDTNMTCHQVLLQAVNKAFNTGDKKGLAYNKALDDLLEQVDIDIKDAAGLTVMARLIMENDGPIRARIVKAWKLHNYKGASLNGMVRGLSAIGYVEEAYRLCEDEKYQVSPIELALGLAYSGNEKALDNYFKKYEILDKKTDQEKKNELDELADVLSGPAHRNISLLDNYFKKNVSKCIDFTTEEHITRVEITGMLAHALVRAAKIYGHQKTKSRKLESLSRYAISALRLLGGGSIEQLHSLNSLIANSEYIVAEALATIAEDKADIDKIFDAIDTGNPLIERNSLRPVIERNILMYIYKGLAKSERARDYLFNYVRQKSRQKFRYILNEEEITYCKLQGYAQVGSVVLLKKELESFRGHETNISEAVKFCTNQCLENGYREAALQIKSQSYRGLHFRDIDCSEINANILNRYIAPMERMREENTHFILKLVSITLFSLLLHRFAWDLSTFKILHPLYSILLGINFVIATNSFLHDYFLVGQKWGFSPIPRLIYCTLKYPLLKPMNHCYRRDGYRTFFLNALPTEGKHYVSDSLSRSRFLETSYNALHHLCFMSNVNRKQALESIYKPLLAEEKANKYFKQANEINKLREAKKIGFSAAYCLSEKPIETEWLVTYLNFFKGRSLANINRGVAYGLPLEIKRNILSSYCTGLDFEELNKNINSVKVLKEMIAEKNQKWDVLNASLDENKNQTESNDVQVLSNSVF